MLKISCKQNDDEIEDKLKFYKNNIANRYFIAQKTVNDSTIEIEIIKIHAISKLKYSKQSKLKLNWPHISVIEIHFSYWNAFQNRNNTASVAVSTNFDNYGLSPDHWRSMLRLHWHTHSFTTELTTATPSSLESAMGSSESCKQYCTLLPVWWPVSVGMSISRRPFVIRSTGYQSSSVSHTRLQQWLSIVCVVRSRHISLTSVRQFRQLLHVPSYFCTPWSPYCCSYEDI